MVLKSKNTINYKIVCQFVGFNIIITLILLIRKKREERSIPVTSSETFKDITLRGLGRDFISFSFPSLFFCCGKRKTKPWHWIGDTFLFRQFERGMSSLSLSPPCSNSKDGDLIDCLGFICFLEFFFIIIPELRSPTLKQGDLDQVLNLIDNLEVQDCKKGNGYKFHKILT